MLKKETHTIIGSADKPILIDTTYQENSNPKKVVVFSHIWVSLPIMMFIMMLYLQFYMGIDRSVSIRLMGDILKAPNQKLKIKFVKDAYLNEQMVVPRLDLLEDKGYIKKLDGEYICNNKGKILAKCALIVLSLYSPMRYT